jgi:hypothetical protein
MNKNALKALDDGMKIEYVSREEVMDEIGEDIMEEGEASVAGYDVAELSGYVNEIIEYLDDPDIKEQCMRDRSIVRISLINKYAETKLPLNFIELLIGTNDDIPFDEYVENHRGIHIELMANMFELMLDIQEGRKDISERATFAKKIQDLFLGDIQKTEAWKNMKRVQEEQSSIANAKVHGF